MSNRTPKTRPEQLPLPFEGATIEIRLTQGYITIVEAIDADLASLMWLPVDKNGRIYVWRKEEPYHVNKKARTLYLHRVIFERVIGRTLDKNELVDHIDNDQLNNRRSNLRLATYIENSQNSKKRSHNTSGYKGVLWSKQRQRWQATIVVNKQRKHLGFFEDPELAYKAYCEAAKKYHGEFARLE